MVFLWFLFLFGVAAHETPLFRASWAFVNNSSPFGGSMGSDIDVSRDIVVRRLGVVDTAEAGIQGNISAGLYDRSTKKFVIGPFAFNSSHRRASEENPFAFIELPDAVTLRPGLYALAANWSVDDAALSSSSPDHTVTSENWGSVAVTSGWIDLAGFIVPFSFLRHVGPTIEFVNAPARALVLDESTPEGLVEDCEDATCRGGGSGWYNTRDGRRIRCDNEAQGGGWELVWAAGVESCRSLGLTSSRTTVGFTGNVPDPAGCRLPDLTTCASTSAARPGRPFGQVLLRRFRLWAIGEVGNVTTSLTPDDFDGVSIATAGGEHVHAFLTASACPCAEGLSGWSCDAHSPPQVKNWVPLFADLSSVCSDGDIKDELVRSVSEDTDELLVTLCQRNNKGEQNLKVSGQVWVRKQNFDVNACPATSSAMLTRAETTMTTATTTTEATVATVATTATTSGAIATILTAVPSSEELGAWTWIVPTVIAAIAVVTLVGVVAALVALLHRARQNLKPAAAVEMQRQDDEVYDSVLKVNNATQHYTMAPKAATEEYARAPPPERDGSSGGGTVRSKVYDRVGTAAPEYDVAPPEA